MPSCVFTASGTSFDVDSFLANVSLKPYTVWHKGDVTRASTGRLATTSGFACDASVREDDFPAQVEDVVRFLKENRQNLLCLRSWPDIEFKSFDFGNHLRVFEDGRFGYQSDLLPPELLRLAGELDIAIELSIYEPARKQV